MQLIVFASRGQLMAPHHCLHKWLFLNKFLHVGKL